MVTHIDTNHRWIFEISTRYDHRAELYSFLKWLELNNARMVGYNNLHFDYPIIHFFINSGGAAGYVDMYNKAQQIIGSQNKFEHTLWENQHFIKQIDLFKIHHFDNMARSTSLKMLQYNMRSNSIIELPYRFDTELSFEQMANIIKYNVHDVDETVKFYHLSKDMIDFRMQLGEEQINYNDTKIGKEYFIKQLETNMPGSCYDRSSGRRELRQTIRENIVIGELLLPYIKFTDPEFNRIHNYFKSQVITETKNVFNDLSCFVNGFEFVFGAGGIHGSVDNEIIVDNIIDVDVVSYYPSLAIVNRLYPSHLSEKFCDIYADVMAQRKQYKKGTPQNAMLKLALNGVYGDSNNKYSPFFDPAYTMSITINGQLLIAMLAERVMWLDGVRLIQINTDGLTAVVPPNKRDEFEAICKEWEALTKLELEYTDYARMMIRDVNNYIAVGTNGKIKRNGAYDYNLGWHQDHSALVIPKAAEAYLVRGEDYTDFIYNHLDHHDFTLRTKVPRSSKLVTDDGRTLQNITRYYISTDGYGLIKLMPPLEKNGSTEMRKIRINVGWTVTECNNIMDFKWDNLNYDYYIQECAKLVNCLKVQH